MPAGVVSSTQPAPQVPDVGSVGKAAALVATMSRYDCAPVTTLQVNVGLVETDVEPFDGASNVGGGSVDNVVKLNIVFASEIPPEFDAAVR